MFLAVEDNSLGKGRTYGPGYVTLGRTNVGLDTLRKLFVMYHLLSIYHIWDDWHELREIYIPLRRSPHNLDHRAHYVAPEEVQHQLIAISRVISTR